MGGLVLVTMTLGAQTAPVQEGVADADQRPTFRADVTLVTTDVIVRDERGQFVADLKREDFEVLEDGVPQEVGSLVLVHGGRVFNLHAPPPPPTEEGIILPPTRPTSDTAGRIFLLFVDDLHIDFRNTIRIRDIFREILTTLVHEGDMFGIVSTGPSSIAVDMTYDRRKLKDAINRITGHAMRPSEIIQGPMGQEGPAEVRYRAQTAFATAYQILERLEQVTNRRKAFVYVSNGYDFNPFSEDREKYNLSRGGLFDPDDENNPFYQRERGLRNRTEFSEADLVGELGELTRVANRVNATFYTIDPRGMTAGADLDEGVDPIVWNTFIRNSQDSLRVLAEETGGIAVVNENFIGDALKRIDAETSDYYVLGFYSNNPDSQRRVRRIEVNVNRPDLEVWSRRAYSIKESISDSPPR